MKKPSFTFGDVFITSYIIWPYILLGGCVVFWMYACAVLGHIPTFSNPDPKALPLFWIAEPIATASFVTFFLSFLFMPALLIIQITLQPFAWRTFLVSHIGYLLHFIGMFLIGEWLFD